MLSTQLLGSHQQAIATRRLYTWRYGWDTSEVADTIILQDAVSSFLDGKDALSENDLADLWWSIFDTGNPRANEGLERFTEILSVDTEIDGFEFKLGAWKLDIRSNTANLVLSSALIGGILELEGAIHLPGYTLPLVLSMLFKIEAVRLEAKDKVLVLLLQEKTGDDGRPRSVDELYNLLPKKERRVIAKSDFVAFIERLRQAGKAKQEIGGTFRITPDGKEPWIKINVPWS
ncbi:hypothetical protein B7C42_00234 [Nocardia cerradoensis]|uniref:Uncharacterized protein n=1 Tax=Nocardia cerradoensis TaxID=85688 RepID=A0A231HE70_9NOCA|nr:hypothetical protein [Nocardia cerradoensis]OXR47112.1 hypothetical protein B7C42_00234 [Nocardia cerradoensis]